MTLMGPLPFVLGLLFVSPAVLAFQAEHTRPPVYTDDPNEPPLRWGDEKPIGQIYLVEGGDDSQILIRYYKRPEYEFEGKYVLVAYPENLWRRIEETDFTALMRAGKLRFGTRAALSNGKLPLLYLSPRTLALFHHIGAPIHNLHFSGFSGMTMRGQFMGQEGLRLPLSSVAEPRFYSHTYDGEESWWHQREKGLLDLKKGDYLSFIEWKIAYEGDFLRPFWGHPRLYLGGDATKLDFWSPIDQRAQSFPLSSLDYKSPDRKASIMKVWRFRTSANQGEKITVTSPGLFKDVTFDFPAAPIIAQLPNLITPFELPADLPAELNCLGLMTESGQNSSQLREE